MLPGRVSGVSFQLQEAYPTQIATQPAQQVQLPQTTPQVQQVQRAVQRAQPLQPLPDLPAQLPAANAVNAVNAVSRLASHVSHVQVSTLEPRRLVARVGAPSAPAALGLQAHVQAVQAVLTAPGPAPVTPATPAQAQPRTLRFADEPSRPPMQPPVQPPQAVQCAAQAAPKSLLRRSTANPASEEAPVSCNALAPYSRDARDARTTPPNGQANRRRKSLPEPELLVVKFLYLSRLPAASWLQTPSQYQLSLHVGEDARNDPPGRPGVYSTPSVQLGNIEKRFGVANI